jgi:hypothetical protein
MIVITRKDRELPGWLPRLSTGAGPLANQAQYACHFPPVEPISSRKPTITDGLEASFQLSLNGRRGRKRSVRVKREN